MSAPERLYGLPYAETLYDDPASVYECEIDPMVDVDERGPSTEPWIIEEWVPESTAAVICRFQSPEALIENLVEWFLDDYGSEASGDVGIEEAHQDPTALVLAQALITNLASMVRWRWADKKVAEHTVTWDADGEPLLDGKPLYVKSANRDGGQS